MRQFFLGFSVVAFYPFENCRPEWRTATFFGGGETAESREEGRRSGDFCGDFATMSEKKELPSKRPKTSLGPVENIPGFGFGYL